MKIKEFLVDAKKTFIELERYVNDGSPSGFTSKYTTSDETNPILGKEYYNLYSVLMKNQVQIEDIGEGTLHLESNEMLLHPDMKDEKIMRSNSISIYKNKYKVSPTSSSRTVILLEPYSGFLKLNYNKMIGRIDRQIAKEHVISSVEITKILEEKIKEGIINDKFHIFREPFGRIVKLENNNEHYEWGCVYREYEPFPRTDKLRYYVPGFSLFSDDVRTKANNEHIPLIIQLIELSNISPKEYLINKIIRPIIDIYFTLIMNCALQIECHAQNVVFGLDENFSIEGIIIRDLESIDKDITISKKFNLGIEFNSFPYKCIYEERYNYQISHSFMFDFKLGEYLLKPLLYCVAKHYNFDELFLDDDIKAISRKYIEMLPKDFFPLDGCWYNYDNIVHDRWKPRNYIANNSPRFR